MITKPSKSLKPIPEKEMSEWARIALHAHRHATCKKPAELRRLGLPMIIWKDQSARSSRVISLITGHMSLVTFSSSARSHACRVPQLYAVAPRQRSSISELSKSGA
jgi:hypothetical protein